MEEEKKLVLFEGEDLKIISGCLGELLSGYGGELYLDYNLSKQQVYLILDNLKSTFDYSDDNLVKKVYLSKETISFLIAVVDDVVDELGEEEFFTLRGYEIEEALSAKEKLRAYLV